MNARRIAFMASLALVALVALAIFGCSKSLRNTLVPNVPPTVRMTAAPFDTSRASPYFYAYKMDWIGDDPDGRIAYYLYCIDPPDTVGVPIPWVRTNLTEMTVFFQSDSSGYFQNPDGSGSLESFGYHVFALCAVDDGGDTSAVIERAFTTFTQCPTVTITNPRPSGLQQIFVTPATRISWSGTDPDGQKSSKPVYYKYILLGPGSSSMTVDQANRGANVKDFVTRYFAYDWAKHGLKGPWDGWTQISGDTTTVAFTNLVPDQDYMFIVVSFDEAGAFSPLCTRDQNMLFLRPSYATTLGPKISLWNDSFNYDYPSGGYVDAPAINIQVPENTSVTFNWGASPPVGSDMEGYRWMLDGNPFDQSARDSITDFAHWSDLSLSTTAMTVGPFLGGTGHDFYVEAWDNNGLKSLGRVHLSAIHAGLKDPGAPYLLIVNDTRMLRETPSGISPGCLNRPNPPWPNAAELDSFLFARGNVIWQCSGAPINSTTLPDGNSDPGIFNGYPFSLLESYSPVGRDHSVGLDSLSRYQNVVWVIDQGVAAVGGAGSTRSDQYALRYMSQPGKFNSLGAYVHMGGRVWLVGGGGAVALSKDLGNNPNNDNPSFTYSSAISPPELQPGRFMYSIAHWQSELKNWQLVPISTVIQKSARAVGGWTQPTYGGLVKSAPDYSHLPLQLVPKTHDPSIDPIPATRRVGTTQGPNGFYSPMAGKAYMEYLSQPNFVLEDLDPRPDVVVEKSTLDTLMKCGVPLNNYFPYEVGGPGKPGSSQGAPLMTYYHGLENPAFVFTGFDLWSYSKPGLVSLVHFVLSDIFAVPQTGPQAAPMRVLRTAPPVWSPPTKKPLKPFIRGHATPATTASAASVRPGRTE